MYRRIVSFIAIAVILLILPISFSSRFRDITTRSLAPITRFFERQRIAVGNFFTDISQIGQLRQDKTNLQGQVASLEQQVSNYDSLKRENTTLQQELGVTGIVHDLPKVLAHVIVQGSDPLDRTFVIDVGQAQGIKNGQPVVASGYLIGRVIAVRNQTADVRSILSNQSLIQAWIPSLGDKGLLIGEGNTVSLEKITQGITVPNKSVVETSGLSGVGQQQSIPLPQGILIGITDTKLSKASDPTQTFQVDVTQDPSSLESVMVVLTSTP